MTDEVRVALLGAGKMASIHARNLAAEPRTALVAVAGGSAAVATAARFSAEHLDVDTALRRPDIDAVVIASPNRVHAEQIAAAASSGKAVLVEKPVDIELDRVDACIAAVGAAADRVVVAFNRRFDPAFVDAHDRLAGGEAGALQQLSIVSRDPAPPPIDYVPGSGGLLRDMTIHDLDMARFMAGEIVEVRAVLHDVVPELAAAGDASGAMLTLTTAAGALVSITNARRNPTGYDQRLEAYGPLGVIAVGNPPPAAAAAQGVHDGPPEPHYAERYRAAYREEIRHLAAVAVGEERPRATLQDGRGALLLALAAIESARTGSRVRI